MDAPVLVSPRMQSRTRVAYSRALTGARRAVPVVAISVIAALIVGAALPLLKDRAIEEADLLIGFLTFATLLPLLHAAWFPDEDMFAPLPLMAALFIVYYVVRALFLRDGPVTSDDLPPNLRGDYLRHITPALELVAACWVGTLVGYFAPFARLLVRLAPRAPILTASANGGRVLVVLIVSYFFQAYMIVTNQHLAFPGEAEIDVTTRGPVLFGAGLSTTALFLYAAGYFRRTQSRTTTILLWSVMIPLALVVGLLSGGKMMVLMPLVVVAVAYHYFRRHVGVRHLAAIAAILVLGVAPLVASYRIVYASNTRSSATLQESAQYAAKATEGLSQTDDFWTVALIGGTDRFHGLDSAMLALKMTPDYIPWSDPTLYQLFPVLAVVPRIFWPDKPKMIVLPNWANEYWGEAADSHTGIACTFIGALYCAFGFWGAVLGMALNGFALRVLYLYLKSNWGVLAAALYCGLLPFILRIENDIPEIWAAIIQTSIVLLLTFLFIRERPRRVRASSPLTQPPASSHVAV